MLVELYPHDPRWVALARGEAARFSGVLGENKDGTSKRLSIAAGNADGFFDAGRIDVATLKSVDFLASSLIESLVLRRPFHAIDDQKLAASLRRFELQPYLL
jgi:hypothetical protein